MIKSEKTSILVIWVLLFVFLSLFMQDTAGAGQLKEGDMALRHQYPWTPVHESTVGKAVQGASAIDLAGDWHFISDPDEKSISLISSGHFPVDGSEKISVPSACIGWGFQADSSAAFHKIFTIPPAMLTGNVLLKCEGMFERARIFINGKELDAHVGWTPFERDITQHIREGENQIIVLITMDGYAPAYRLRIRKGGYPDTGGILRPIKICAVPKTYIKDLFIIPKLNKKSGQWSLEAQILLENTSDLSPKIHLSTFLRFANGTQIPLPRMNKSVELQPFGQVLTTLSQNLENINPWTAEAPNLYHLILCIGNGQNQTIVAESFGFRTIDIQGERLLINGKPVFLRGIGYKGGHADYGNASPFAVLEREIELMKQANINTVRLGWAFKSPELHQICDEKGMYVISGIGGDQFYLEDELHLQQYFEAFNRLKNCPSVLIWEMMNENPRTPTDAMKKIIELGKQIDPHRKFCHPGANYKELDLICPHYQPRLFSEDKRDGRPFLPTEYAHTPAYEIDKLKSDPGIHDLWGYSMKRGWDILKQHPWVTGVITFAWRDPRIRNRNGKIIPALHNEAEWGIVNESFRIKPEYHHLFKVYSPVQISVTLLIINDGKKPEISITNTYDFTNLKDLAIIWQLMDSGKILQEGSWELDLPAGNTGRFEVPVTPSNPGAFVLQLIFKDDRGRLVQYEQIPFQWQNYQNDEENPPAAGKVKIIQDSVLTEARWQGGSYFFENSTGALVGARVGTEELMLRGPDLNQRIALPAQGRWFDWRDGNCTATINWTQRVFSLGLEEFTFEESADSTTATFRIVQRYSNGNMETMWKIFPDGQIELTAILPPQGYGISWRFPVFCRIVSEEMKSRNLSRRFAERLAWRKNSLWSWLPADHLGRNVGIATFLNPHDPQTHAMKINTAYLAVGPEDKSINLVIRDSDARIHTRCYFYYNEFELFVQGRLEDDYDYFDRTDPLRAMPHALSDEQRTFSFGFRFTDKKTLEDIEKTEINSYHTLISRTRFWESYHDDLQVGNKQGSTVKGLTPFYIE